MTVTALIASLLAAVGIGYGSRRLARILVIELSLGPFAAGTLTAAIGLGVFLCSVGIVGRLAHRFDAGLAAGAAAGVLLAALARWLRAPDERDLPRAPRRVEVGVLVATALMVILYAHLAFTYQMHDEYALFGHKSMVEQLRRGTYPVYFPPMPGLEARYHYAFDVLAGVLTHGFDLSTDLAIDLTTLGCVLLMCWAAAAVAIDAGAERSAPLAVLAIHLGAGLAAVMLAGDSSRHPRCLAQYHHPSCQMDLYPTQIMNVFQHPVSLGVPLLLAMVIVLPRVAGTHEPSFWKSRGWWIASLLAIPMMGGLALSQLVYYGLGALAALASLPLWIARHRAPRLISALIGAAALLVVLGASFLLAHALGGMLAEHPAVDTTLMARRLVYGFPAKTSVGGILIAHLANLGVGFALIPVFAVVALWERRPQVAMLLAFACGGLLVAQLYNYQRSWDIVKFPSASSFALSMLYVLVVDRALAARPFPWTWARRLGAGLVMITGITTAIFVSFPLSGAERKLYDDSRLLADPLVKQAIDWLIANGYRDEEVIYAQKNVAAQLSIYGGLSPIGGDTDFYYLGIQMKELTRREALAKQIKSAMSEKALRDLGVRWVVLSDEELKNLGLVAQRELASSRFEVAHTIEDPRPGKRRRIWRVMTTRTSSAAATSAKRGAR